MQKPLQKIVWRLCLAGFLAACLLFAIISIGSVRVGGPFVWVVLIPWPTFPLMMSAEAGGGTGGEFLAFLISALANAAVYGLIGSGGALLYRRFLWH